MQSARVCDSTFVKSNGINSIHVIRFLNRDICHFWTEKPPLWTAPNSAQNVPQPILRFPTNPIPTKNLSGPAANRVWHPRTFVRELSLILGKEKQTVPIPSARDRDSRARFFPSHQPVRGLRTQQARTHPSSLRLP